MPSTAAAPLLKRLDIILIAVLVLTGSFVIAHSNDPVAIPRTNNSFSQTLVRNGSARTTDLGNVELVAQQPTVFALGSNTTCTLTGRETPAGVQINVELKSLNADGKPKSDRAVIATLSGRPAGILVGGTLMEFTASLKQPSGAVNQ